MVLLLSALHGRSAAVVNTYNASAVSVLGGNAIASSWVALPLLDCACCATVYHFGLT